MTRWLGWTIAGLCFGVLAALVAAGAAGGGHGTYVPAAILFPFTMSISALVGKIPTVLVALALAQYPIYGVLVALAKRSTRVWAGLVCVHGVSAAAALFLVTQSASFG